MTRWHALREFSHKLVGHQNSAKNKFRLHKAFHGSINLSVTVKARTIQGNWWQWHRFKIYMGSLIIWISYLIHSEWAFVGKLQFERNYDFLKLLMNMVQSCTSLWHETTQEKKYSPNRHSILRVIQILDVCEPIGQKMSGVTSYDR